MNRKHLTLHSESSVCTRALVLAILESRRAYQLAMSLAQRLLADTGPLSAVPEEQTSGNREPHLPRADELRLQRPPRRATTAVSPYERRRRRNKREPHTLRLVGAQPQYSSDRYETPMIRSTMSAATPI